MPVLIELLIVLAGVTIVIITVIAILANPAGPAIAGPCRLVVRKWRKDYCSGACPGGKTCVVTSTKPWAWGMGTQAATCACGVVVGPGGGGAVGPGGGGALVNPSGGLPSDIGPVTGDTHPH